MSGKSIDFDDKKIKRSDFYKNKKAFQIDHIDVNKVLVSKKEPYDTKNSFKYFIGYSDNDVIRPLYLRLPKITGYTRKFDENSTMSFRANNKQFLTLIWVCFLGVRFEVGWGKITPCLKLVRITLEASNLARRYISICSFRKYTFQCLGSLNFADVSIF